jgi:hypothetical protein
MLVMLTNLLSLSLFPASLARLNTSSCMKADLGSLLWLEHTNLKGVADPEKNVDIHT